AHHLRVHAGQPRERLDVQTWDPDQGCVHDSCFLGSNFEAPASSSKSLCSSLVSLAGTMILASARRLPGFPRGFGKPRPLNRSRFPLDVPFGTLTDARPPGVWTGT